MPREPRRPSYTDMVAWIAHNDQPHERNVTAMQWQVSVLLVADCCGRTPLEVAAAVVKFRTERLEVS